MKIQDHKTLSCTTKAQRTHSSLLATSHPSHSPYKGITHFAHRQQSAPNSHCPKKRKILNSLQSKSPKMAYKHEDLSPPLDSTSSPPPLFDGTTRLYVSYTCPFAQRVWITRNYKGLQDKIKLVPINLQNRPAWYKEKVYPENKVPSLEHNGKVIGESLDLIKYVDSNFEGPSLFPTDPERRKFGEEIITYVDTFTRALYSSFKGDAVKEADAQFDYLENALKKFDDGPFFLGQFSLVDIAYIPFVERFQVFLSEVFKYDITAGRPKLAEWFEEINKIEAYKVTKTDPKELVEFYKKRFLDQQ